jgi:GNAT superfamily N-acetyltransferase
MERIVDSNNHCLLVAERPDGELVGWIHAFLSQLLESDYRIEIGGLIVEERCRRTGIGRKLLHAIENWAAEHAVTELSVRCREDRAEAHKFYEDFSFRHIKTQRVFRKRL